ncbi:hypothetical protein [Duncaniella muris]|uniref:hypothetical protein n=1 Tax=Duncaniella muris TaxID=2094150 RepID=UPI002714F1B2|nr:hypothetical protein [Duncaniella muris]
MGQEVTNFGRFFSAYRRLQIQGDPEEIRRDLILQYTGGRTDSLKEMTRQEYTLLCEGVELMTRTRDELKKRRSIALKLMQELGVDTTDWAKVDNFCRHPRISGKRFCKLDIEDLMDLAGRLRTMKRKGWKRTPEWQSICMN